MSKTFKKMIAAITFTLATIGAQAATVVTYGMYPSYNELNNMGNTINFLTQANAHTLAGADVLMLSRNVQTNDEITEFVFNGGTLITDFYAGYYGMKLLGGRAAYNFFSQRTGDQITMNAAGLALGLSSYSDADSTEFFIEFPSLGNGKVYATRGSNGATALVGGAYGKGFVWVPGYDWTDNPSIATVRFLDSLIDANVNDVPEPTSLALAVIALFGLGATSRLRSR